MPLTADPARHAERILAAAMASMQAGAFGKALDLLATAEAGPLDEFQHARVDLMRGTHRLRLGFRQRRSRVAAEGRETARAVRPGARARNLPDRLARRGQPGHYAGGDVLPEICRAIRALPPASGPPRPLDLLLDGLARLGTDGRAAAIPTLQRAAKAHTDMRVEDVLRWGSVSPRRQSCGTTRACTRSPRGRSSSSATPARLRWLPIHLIRVGHRNRVDRRLRETASAHRGGRRAWRRRSGAASLPSPS